MTITEEEIDRDPGSLSRIPTIPRGYVARRVALYDRVDPTPGMMMVCLVTAAVEKRVALPRVISHTIMSTEGKTHMHYGCGVPIPCCASYTPVPFPSSVNHVTGLVNSANDLKRAHLIFFFPCFSCFFMLAADYNSTCVTKYALRCKIEYCISTHLL